MKNKIVLLGIVTLFAIVAMAASVEAAQPPNTVWFEPENSSAEYCNTTDVDILLNATEGVTGFDIWIEYDPGCANITKAAPGDFPSMFLVKYEEGATHIIGATNDLKDVTGTQLKLATITIHCENDGYCTTLLDLNESCEIGNEANERPEAAWHDGTFSCRDNEKPDLVITEKYETLVNGTIMVTYTVANKGAGDADVSNTSISVDGTVLKDQVPGLKAGENYTSTVGMIECPCGTNVTVLVCADCDKVVDEEDEENNCLWNVFVCPPCPEPRIEVNKTVWDPVNNVWVDRIYDAEIGDIYKFRCEVQNTGNVNLTNITFWDSLSCSLEFAGNMTVCNRSVNDTLIPPYPFKPKRLHPANLTWDPYAPISNEFVELCPDQDKKYHLSSWEDTNGDGKLSHCDQIDMTDLENGNISWYHVDLLPYTLLLTNTETNDTIYFDSELDYLEINLSEPWKTEWKEVCCCKDSYYLEDWRDNGNGILDFCDYIVLRNEKTGEITEYHVEEVAIDLVISREGRINDYNPESFVLTPYPPYNKVVIEADARVVGCGEDYNLLWAKGKYEGRWIRNSDDAWINVPGEPDLVIQEKYEDWVSLENKTYTVTYTICNDGDADAGVSNTTITIDGVDVMEDPVPALAVGECYNSTVGPFTMSDTNDTIMVCADNQDEVDESDEENNCLENVFDLPRWPDLVIREKHEDWVSLENKTYTVTYTVCNDGDADAGVSNTTITIDGVDVLEDPVPALAVGECYNSTVGPFTMSDTNDTIMVCADNQEEVDESDEENNCLENVFVLPEKPDLVIREKHEDWVSLENKTYTVTYTVCNDGDADAGVSNTTITIDGVDVLEDPVPALAVGECYNSTVGPFTMSDTNDTIMVCADNQEEVDESDEENNCLENVFVLPEKPDLVIREKHEDWVSLENKTYTVTYTVCNDGDADAGVSNTTITIDGVDVLEDPVPALAVGECYNSTVGPFTMSDTNDTIMVCADNQDEVDESDEENNCLANVFDLPRWPDLVIREKHEDWVSLENKTYTVTYTVCNDGDADAGVSNTTITIDGVDMLEDPVPALAVGECYNSTVGPFTMSDTNDTIMVCADNQEEVDESDEENNCLANVFDLPRWPDLVIREKHEDWVSLENKTYTVTYTVCNDGDADAGVSNTTITIDGVDVLEDPVPALAVGECYNSTVGPFTMSDTNDTIMVCADNQDEVDESDEENNCLENVFDLPRWPDLVIREKHEDWVSLENKTYTVTYTVCNDGDADAGVSNTTITIDGVDVLEDPVPALAVGECYNSTVGPFTMSDTNDTIMVCADNQEEVDESDEENNCLENVFVLPEKPDLVIREKHEDWVSLENKTYTVTYTVCNDGDADAGVSNTTITIDGVDVLEDPVPALAVGECYNSTVGPFTMSDTNDTIMVCADNQEEVDESDEENNCLENVFVLPEKPDLVIREKHEDWVSLENKTYTVTYTVCNDGDADAGVSNTTITIDGVDVLEDPVPALAVGECYNSTVGPFTMSDTNDTIMVCADNQDEVDESDEENNCLANVFDLPRWPDLVIREKHEDWVSLENKTYTVTYTVCNDGDADAGVSNTTITIDGVDMLEDPVPALAVGECYNSTVGPFTMSDTNDTIMVCADNQEEVDESDEENNCLANVFDLPRWPDLVIREKHEDWVSLENKTYTVTYTVCNDGDADAGVSNTTITIDGVDVLEDPVPALAVGECYNSTVGPFTMSDTNDTIMVCADNQEEVDESDEENNCLANVFESIRPEGGIGTAVTPRFNIVNSSVNLSIKIVNTENFDDVFLVSLTNESIPNDWKADLAWFNWTSKEVAIPAGGEVMIPLRADVPTGISPGKKAFRVVVESTLWTPTVFDTGFLEIL